MAIRYSFACALPVNNSITVPVIILSIHIVLGFHTYDYQGLHHPDGMPRTDDSTDFTDSLVTEICKICKMSKMCKMCKRYRMCKILLWSQIVSQNDDDVKG